MKALCRQCRYRHSHCGLDSVLQCPHMTISKLAVILCAVVFPSEAAAFLRMAIQEKNPLRIKGVLTFKLRARSELTN